MDYSITFARHFARLVWLLLHESENVGEQKAALRALITTSKEGPVTLATTGWRLTANGTLVPDALTGVTELAAQLIGHAVQELVVQASGAAADLLGVGRILAAEPLPGNGGRVVQEKLAALGARTVTARTEQGTGTDTAVLDAFILEAELVDDPTVPPATPPGGGIADIAPNESGTAAEKTALGADFVLGGGFDSAAPPAPAGNGATPRHSEGMLLPFAARRATASGTEELFAQLDGSSSHAVVTTVLDELVVFAETAQREGRLDAVADAYHGLVIREPTLGEGELRRVFVMAMRRMSKPALLRAVAQLLPRRLERREQFMVIFARAGEDAAEALVDLLANAGSLAERRAFFNALKELQSGVPALIHMLGDARWYVARNAADLLGEMQSPEAGKPLTETLKHDDDRVRRAAATALARVGTPEALLALHAALRDTAPDVRSQAAAGLGMRKGQKQAVTLSKALDDEQDAEVRIEIIRALGKMGTPDAVQKLIDAAKAEGWLFKKKPVPYRVAAVRALGEARTPAAIAALKDLSKDKDREVQEAAIDALASGRSKTDAI